MYMHTGKLVFLLALFAASSTAQAGCYDLSKAEPRQLAGLLSYRIFAGPPNFEDVQKGDTPEPGFILKLATPICLQGDEFADPAASFDEVQLVETEQTAGTLAKYKQQNIAVTLERAMAAHTGHHHRPLVAWVTSISAPGDSAEEYGTAASTIRAFYLALAAVDGDTASNFVVAEKRISGPFSAHALTRFYRNLTEPLQLINIQPSGKDQFKVRYTFKNGNARCDGEAAVTTTKRKGVDFINGIKALNGC
ncbi:hypothetical protein JJB09_20390 [Rhizobium sp. KVB221]|uniref:DUF4431 domain-containing protein n=1 Tax=Rhizobium setariae TaxID=2801340 RepID=A0A937CP10_9HYPH|nr:hypothetical protein [Rhizobium setariae]MBL0374376.1 hypothetical protein [Rhizobium setariae]